MRTGLPWPVNTAQTIALPPGLRSAPQDILDADDVRLTTMARPAPIHVHQEPREVMHTLASGLSVSRRPFLGVAVAERGLVVARRLVATATQDSSRAGVPAGMMPGSKARFG